MITCDLVDLVVIDDDSDLRMLTEITFRMQGWNVLSAPDGKSGLDVLRELAAAHAHPAVLLDVQMPDIDGWEVLSEIRNDPSLADLAVVLCTVRAGEEAIERGYGLGADGYVAKPFDVDDIVERVGAIARLTPDERAAIRAGRTAN